MSFRVGQQLEMSAATGNAAERVFPKSLYVSGSKFASATDALTNFSTTNGNFIHAIMWEAPVTTDLFLGFETTYAQSTVVKVLVYEPAGDALNLVFASEDIAATGVAEYMSSTPFSAVAEKTYVIGFHTSSRAYFTRSRGYPAIPNPTDPNFSTLRFNAPWASGPPPVLLLADLVAGILDAPILHLEVA
jgi:hypothetical protein